MTLSFNVTMRAAEQGLGVALGVFPMTTDWVTSGRLAVPFALRVPLQAKIRLLYRQADADDGVFAELAAWLREQYAALPALPRGRLVRRSSALRGAGKVRRKVR